jgi:hypothetical protein
VGVGPKTSMQDPSKQPQKQLHARDEGESEGAQAYAPLI